MKLSLRVRFFLWLLLLLAVFVCIQAVLYAGVEIVSMLNDPRLELRSQLMEVVAGVGMDIIMLPLLAILAWWMSDRMLQPIRTISVTAREISGGDLDRRIDTVSMPDDEMSALAGCINSAFDRYRGAVDRLQRFTGDVSHQLRTPLSSIRTTSEVALSHPRTADEYRDALGSILEDVSRLSRLTEQLLKLARLDDMQLSRRFARLDLADVVNQADEFFGPLCEAKGIALETRLAAGVTVDGIADLLFEVIGNLLQNAVRHTPEGGRIQVCVQMEGGEAVVRVSDTGPGVPDALRADLFDHGRVPHHDQAAGSGLGLALAADVARIHGGALALEDAPGWGAVFRMRLPCSSTPPSPVRARLS